MGHIERVTKMMDDLVITVRGGIAGLKAENKRLNAMAKEAKYEGIEEGIRRYAWWKDGVQYVGSCGTTLESALEMHHKAAGEEV